MTGDLRVCFVGDSFVAGTGDPDHLGWAGRLSARTHRTGRAVTAYGLGVRRQTSADVLGRWEAECAPRLPTACDARVVVSFGVNDATVEGGRQRVAVADAAAHLGRLLTGARARGWPVLVVGPPPVADAGHNARTAQLDRQFERRCATAGVPYVGVLDVLLGTPAWMDEVAAGDGAHPGAAGYEALAQHLWPAWQAWSSPTPR